MRADWAAVMVSRARLRSPSSSSRRETSGRLMDRTRDMLSLDGVESGRVVLRARHGNVRLRVLESPAFADVTIDYAAALSLAPTGTSPVVT